MKAVLALADGRIFSGKSFGAGGEATGEVVFNTAMTGYQEVLTDPSYKGQMVTMTYTQIGNTGINTQDIESRGLFLSGFIVKEYQECYSNWRASMSLDAYLKENGGKSFVIVDAGMNDLLRPSLYEAFHRIEPVVARDRAAVRVDVVGPVCETGDFFARDRELPAVEPGDLLALRDAGAYGFVMASNYNQRPRPAELLIEDGVARPIRRRETFEDLIRTEV